MKTELSVFSLCLLLAAPVAGQTSTRNWKDRAEYNLYESVSRAPDTNERLRLLTEWERLYPSSDFNLERLRTFVLAHDAAGQGNEACARAQRLFALAPSDMTAMWALCRWGPRLKQASPEATAVVRKAATDLLDRLDELVPDGRSRREMGSLFDNIENGAPVRTERSTDARRQELRAKTEQLAREALAWANAREVR